LVGSALFADLVTRLRDVGRYARKGIVSIPLQDLEVGGISPSDLLERIPNQAMRDLLTRQAARATSLYRDNLMTADTRIDTNARLPAVALARLRLRLLEEIRASGFQILDRRMELTPLRKFWIAARTR
jgi:phytoene synthase